MNNKISSCKAGYMTSFIRLIAILAFTVVITACGENPAEATTSKLAADTIIAKNAHIRAMPPGLKVTAMFLTLENPSETPHSLVKVEGNVSDAVELHEHKHENGMMKMGQVSHIDIPKKGSVALASGGYHVMIIGLKQELKLGEKVAMKLIFEDGSSQDIMPEVMKINPN